MLQTNQTSEDYITQIANAIYLKSKLAFRYRRNYLREQAAYFSPAYRDFLLKIIKNGSLKIKGNWKDAYICNIEDEYQVQVSRRQKNIVEMSFKDKDSLAHELGHSVDFWFGQTSALSKIVIIEDDKTLYDIFKEEFEQKHEEIYQAVMGEYKNIIDSTVKEGAFDLIKDNFTLYSELKKIPVCLDNKEITKKRRRIQKKLYDNGFVETYYQFVIRKGYSILNSKYSPILDALSARYNFDDFFLSHHEKSYYDCDNYKHVQEFFANMFAAKVTSKHTYYDYLIKYLPHSFSAFEKLFVIFYDHIQNNKRFVDVKIRKEEK